jgi:HAD superfamily hydrolase (TIGR01459 family)
MIFQKNITEIAKNYDYFILDIWGVIHDGSQAYPGVLEQMKYLRSLNKKVCFLSNAPRRAKKAAEMLKKFGIDESFYDFIMTSGEATFLFLQEYKHNSAKLEQVIGNVTNSFHYYYIGPDKDADLLNGLGYSATDDAAKADFVVATGFNHDLSVPEEKLPQLKEAIKNNLTMICVNPDLIVVKQNGNELICAGILALEYQKMGGKVVYFGKPHNLVYDQVFRLFSNPDKTKVLAIGDGIETDILGANNNKIDSALIAGGILANELQIKHGELPDKDLMQEICDKYKAYPQFVIGGL